MIIDIIDFKIVFNLFIQYITRVSGIPMSEYGQYPSDTLF